MAKIAKMMSECSFLIKKGPKRFVISLAIVISGIILLTARYFTLLSVLNIISFIVSFYRINDSISSLFSPFRVITRANTSDKREETVSLAPLNLNRYEKKGIN